MEGQHSISREAITAKKGFLSYLRDELMADNCGSSLPGTFPHSNIRYVGKCTCHFKIRKSSLESETRFLKISTHSNISLLHFSSAKRGHWYFLILSS